MHPRSRSFPRTSASFVRWTWNASNAYPRCDGDTSNRRSASKESNELLGYWQDGTGEVRPIQMEGDDAKKKHKKTLAFH